MINKMRRYFELKNELYLIECEEERKIKERLDREFITEDELAEALSNNTEYQVKATEYSVLEHQLFRDLGVMNNQAIDQEAEAWNSISY